MTNTLKQLEIVWDGQIFQMYNICGSLATEGSEAIDLSIYAGYLGSISITSDDHSSHLVPSIEELVQSISLVSFNLFCVVFSFLHKSENLMHLIIV